MSQKKITHFTRVERHILLQILEKYRNTIEIKRSDSCTLNDKKKAWMKVTHDYNNCLHINQQRTVTQLKKLWSNMKHAQRNALIRENQELMRTGSGPKVSSAEVDPDVARIAPDLMTMAPTIFSSNALELVTMKKENTRFENRILEEEEEVQEVLNESKNEEEENFLVNDTVEHLNENEYTEPTSGNVNESYVQQDCDKLCSSFHQNSDVQAQYKHNRNDLTISQSAEVETIENTEDIDLFTTTTTAESRNQSTKKMYHKQKVQKTDQSKLTAASSKSAIINNLQPCAYRRTKKEGCFSQLVVHKTELIKVQKAICDYDLAQKKEIDLIRRDLLLQERDIKCNEGNAQRQINDLKIISLQLDIELKELEIKIKKRMLEQQTNKQ